MSEASETPSASLSSVALPRPRVGLVGCGNVGGVHRDRLLQESVDIVAVCDPDADALARMAHSLPRRPKLFRSEQDLIAAGVVDAVVLCTPHGRHAGQIRTALQAGVHVLCEKPFVTDAEVARELVDLACDRNLTLYVAYTRRSRGHARFLLQSAQGIGPIRNVLVTRSQPWFQRHRRTWRMHENEGGGFLLDAGASLLDLLLHFLPQPIEMIDAALSRPHGVEGMDVDVRSSIRLTFADDARAELVLIGDANESSEHIQIFGDNGSAGWNLRPDAPGDLYARVTDAESGIPGAGTTQAADAAPYRTISPDTAFVAALHAGYGASCEATTPDVGRDLYDAGSALPVVELVERIYREAVWG